ncbi:hypothetical protein PV04_06838 [Phialophora macrospora]|uniref:MYND-type domain-containing protein n=1 Tax=Phialophora macrospora TaxID=1851006 RepID=A0A0D2FLK6_9EURO|nr:hypothetical protein PV04_06838 [Phialophora macrospora]
MHFSWDAHGYYTYEQIDSTGARQHRAVNSIFSQISQFGIETSLFGTLDASCWNPQARSLQVTLLKTQSQHSYQRVWQLEQLFARENKITLPSAQLFILLHSTIPSIMLGPASQNSACTFYPIGNTPPVDLTESLPPGQDATILLLGCGDVRNVLFTSYVRPATDKSKLDITCCDVNAEIIARNALLYTLIIDDLDGRNTDLLWNIYYHLKIDDAALELLRRQAQKLADLAGTLEQWHHGPYSALLRFCDKISFDIVVELWRFYGVGPSQPFWYRAQQRRLKQSVGRAQQAHRKSFDGYTNTSALRSAGPCQGLLMEDASNFAKRFWSTGVALDDEQLAERSKHHNPMFGELQGILTVAGSTEPLQSFHLAPAYAPLTGDSPLRPALPEGKDTMVAAAAARTEFRVWCERFRSVGRHLSLRFTVSDALRFCQVLHTYKARPGVNLPLWHRDLMHYEPLILDVLEYSVKGSAPVAFDVINTSNLVDHLGCLNLLAATAPLLKNEGSAVYMELLFLRDESLHAYASGILCGDIPTVSTLFGLNPTQYWSNASTYSLYTECVLNALSEADMQSQGRSILMWKRANLNNVKFDPRELAQFVYQMSLRMFEHESEAAIRSKTRTQLIRHPAQHYTRAGFSIILRVIRDNQLVDFGPFIEQLCSLLSGGPHLDLGRRYQHSLFVHLHQLGLFTPAIYKDNMDGAMLNIEASPLRKWSNIPPALHLTFVVSRSIKGLTSGVRPELIIYEVTLQSSVSRQQSSFPDLQLGVGSIYTTGIRHTESFTIRLETDTGDPDLVVSTLVPTCLVLQDATLSTEVLFHLITTPVSQRLSSESGKDLMIQKFKLSDPDVFITKDPPNLAGYMSASVASESLPSSMSQMALSSQGPYDSRTENVMFKPILNDQRNRIQQLNVHIDLSLTMAAELMSSGASVQIKQQSSFGVELLIKSGLASFQQDIKIPFPLDVSAGKLRIARSSSYVEIIAPMASTAWLSHRPESAFPISVHRGKPVLDNLPYVHLDGLPTLDTRNTRKLEWLNAHLGAMFSAREAKMYEQITTLGGSTKDLRYNLKTILIDLIRNAAGFGVRPRQQIVAIGSGSPQAGLNVFLLVPPSSLKLDLSSLSIMLDAALVPAPILLPPHLLIRIVEHCSGKGIAWDIEHTTFQAWKHVIAAYVERCRDWEHSSACEYAAPGKSGPLSAKPWKSPVCSCGLGKFPEDYMPGLPFWKEIAEYCVRVAISPISHIPLVEESPNLTGRVGWVWANWSKSTDVDNLHLCCWSCKAEATAERKLLKCARCKVAQYCSKECQVRDWKEGGHKLKCM